MPSRLVRVSVLAVCGSGVCLFLLPYGIYTLAYVMACKQRGERPATIRFIVDAFIMRREFGA